MYKHVFSLLLLLAILQTAHAQDNIFGVIGGANYSRLARDFADRFNHEGRLAYHFGGIAEFSLKEKISFSPRFIYSSQGYLSTFNSDEIGLFLEPTQIVKTSNRSNYINLPLLLRVYFSEKFGVNIGPQIGFLLNTAVVIKQVEGSNDVEEGNRESAGGDFKLDYGATGGIFYNLSKKTFLELNYYRGFSNISRGGITDITNNNSVFQLSVGHFLF